ncbi:hypothetical protein AC1031_012386 [Aphanomyces cochlioides]|nr:hypothetical protein AC1031_012386 [Aphanomyces cochlioides]
MMRNVLSLCIAAAAVLAFGQEQPDQLIANGARRLRTANNHYPVRYGKKFWGKRPETPAEEADEADEDARRLAAEHDYPLRYGKHFWGKGHKNAETPAAPQESDESDEEVRLLTAAGRRRGGRGGRRGGRGGRRGGRRGRRGGRRGGRRKL